MQVKVRDLINLIESYFPLYLAESWDNPGLQIGSPDQQIQRVIISLDLDTDILELARRERADMIVTHHPLFFRPIKSIHFEQPAGGLIKSLIKSNITVYSAHTNLDAGEIGLSQVLAEKLGLQEIAPLDNYRREELFKVVVYVPVSHQAELRSAMSQAGAGHIGKYSECSFRSQGKGTFRPGEDARPFVGERGRLEEVEECRLEMVLYKQDLGKVLAAMEKAHPYEEAAYDIYRLENESRVYSMGRKGWLKEPLELRKMAQLAKHAFKLDSVRVSGDLDKEVQSIAVVSGSGAGFIEQAIKQNMDALVTGDIKYHEAKDAAAQGLAIIDAGHQGTEQIVSHYLGQLLSESSRKMGWEIAFIPGDSAPLFQNL
jgi:dinuclear metal center YbgI/SA1388 family protein